MKTVNTLRRGSRGFAITLNPRLVWSSDANEWNPFVVVRRQQKKHLSRNSPSSILFAQSLKAHVPDGLFASLAVVGGET